jgi:DNA topoisomerase-1
LGALKTTGEICEECKAPIMLIINRGRPWKFCVNMDCPAKKKKLKKAEKKRLKQTEPKAKKATKPKKTATKKSPAKRTNKKVASKKPAKV